MKADIEKSFTELKKSFIEQSYPQYEERVLLLKNIKKRLLSHEEKIFSALCRDYGYRSSYDTLLGDFLPTIQHINYTIKKLKKWIKPERRSSGLILFPSQVKVHYQPLGVVGVIVPWNFPLFLAFGPMISALAAGNKVMLKLSELTPHTNKVLQEIFKDLWNHIRFFEGEKDIGSYFSSLPFDHLFFTGSTQVGKMVAKAAAENLTPVTLELGGKSPVIIGDDISLDFAIENILFGKSINAGQICVAPDYVFIPKGKEKDFVKIYQEKFRESFHGKNKHKYSHLIHESHVKRLEKYLSDALEKGARIIPLKEEKAEGTRFYPHLVTGVKPSMLMMQEEIFGPILPVMTYEKIDQAISFINERPKPLALYLMGQSKELKRKILEKTQSGGVCFNDTIVHVGVEDTPFGGVGDSGLGQYHGREGFLTFSKARTVLSSPAWLPRNKFLLKYRDLAFKVLKKFI